MFQLLRRNVLKPIVLLTSLAGTLLICITFTPTLEWWALLLAGPWNDARGDVLVVLSADYIDGDIIGVGSYWRSVYAVWAWRSGGFKKVIISGAHVVTGPMRRFMVSQGVPESAVSIEGESTSTKENAIYTCALLKRQPGLKVILLSSDYHMYRASRAFQKAGCEIVGVPIPDVLKRKNNRMERWTLFGEMVRETAKIVYYKTLGWI